MTARAMLTGAAALLLLGAGTAQAADPSADRVARQRAAMAALSWMDGMWRGPAVSLDRGGKTEMTQTERVGPFLDGSLKVVEGKALDAAGKPNGFNALGVISYDPDADAYSFHTFAQGYAQVVPLAVTPQGWSWQREAGPGRVIRYTASNAGGKWTETGVITGPNMPPAGVTLFSMTLDRVGATDWPRAGSPGG